MTRTRTVMPSLFGISAPGPETSIRNPRLPQASSITAHIVRNVLYRIGFPAISSCCWTSASVDFGSTRANELARLSRPGLKTRSMKATSRSSERSSL